MSDTGILSGEKKVVIVGAGFVGSTIAYALMLKNWRERLYWSIPIKKGGS